MYEPGTGTAPGGSSAGSTGVQDRVKESARETTEQVQEKAQEVGVQARDKARTQVNERTTDAGGQMRSVADALRRTGGNLQEEGKEQPAKVVRGVADRVERLGGYLEQVDADRLMRDVEDFGRRRPWAIAGIGAVVGLAASRFLKASSASRHSSDSMNGGMYSSSRPDYVPPVTGPAIPATTGGPMTSPTATPPPSDPASPAGY